MPAEKMETYNRGEVQKVLVKHVGSRSTVDIGGRKPFPSSIPGLVTELPGKGKWDWANCRYQSPR